MQQQGFRLIVLMMGSQEHFPGLQMLAERCVAGMAGNRFQAFPGRNLQTQAFTDQRQTQRLANGTAMLRPISGHGLQTMVNMNGAEIQVWVGTAQTGTGMKQYVGIHPATESQQISRGRMLSKKC
jgi:hypothetical protein